MKHKRQLLVLSVLTGTTGLLDTSAIGFNVLLVCWLMAQLVLIGIVELLATVNTALTVL